MKDLLEEHVKDSYIHRNATPEQILRMEKIAEAGRLFGYAIVNNTTEKSQGGEFALAIQKIDMAILLANASIYRYE